MAGISRRSLLGATTVASLVGSRTSWAHGDDDEGAADDEPAGAVEERQIELDGLQLTLSKPRPIVQGVPRAYLWFPDLLRFRGGELMLTTNIGADSVHSQSAQAVYLSKDRGQSFAHAYDIGAFQLGAGEPRISLPDRRIVGPASFLRPDPPGQARAFRTHYWTYQNGGDRCQFDAWDVTVEGFPADVVLDAKGRFTWANIYWFGDIVPVDDHRWISTITLRYAGQNLWGTEAVVSQDQGRSWRWLSTIAGPDAVPSSAPNEGFDEPSLIRLSCGRLMCVSRVGPGVNYPLARTFSSDGGKTWSPVDRLAAYSVAPQVRRLAHDVIVLSVGRPGLFLWFSTDGRGMTWQSLDVVAHHNLFAQTVLPPGPPSGPAPTLWYDPSKPMTTGYTSLLRVASNRFWLVYDRTPRAWDPLYTGWTPDLREPNQIFMLEVAVRRT
jgi:hypothetical protein